jgi:hypothetical protein
MKIIKKLYNILRYGNSKPSNQKIALVNSWRVFKNHSALFIHIPKAAGISFHQGIYKRESLGHVSIVAFIQQYGEKKIEDIFKFTIVRNPYDRLASAYNYLKQGGRNKNNDREYQKFIIKFENFEDFVLNGFDTDEYLTIEHLLPQVYWLYDDNGLVQMDYIGFFESIDKDFKIIASKIGKDATAHLLPQENKTLKKEEISFSPTMRSVVNRIYSEDFARFGYEKL